MDITCVMGPFLPVPPVAGGAVERRFYSVCRAMAAMGHHVTMISRRYPGLPNEEIDNGVHHVRLPSFDAPRNKLLYRIQDVIYALRVRAVLPKSDVTITNSVSLPLLLPRQRSGIVYVNVARFPKRQFGVYRHVDRLQPVSHAIARAIIAQTPSVAHLVRVVPNAIGDKFVHAIDPARGNRRRTVLFVGRIAREKGIDLLIRAFGANRPDHSDWRLKIVGPWDIRLGGDGEELINELRALSDEVGAEAEFTGPIFDEQQLIATYKDAEIFVYPSIAEQGEAFGVAPLEAMACGCATIVSSLECFDEFLEVGVNGLRFDHRDVANNTLEETLSVLMDDTNLREMLARGGVATAERHQPTRIARAFLDDFDKLLKERAVV